ncbi:MAG: 5-formyltetrahydrofolate cyclo-ligase [Prevotella sp.]|nr:5-formyltetrahydrofolate cyclo-ligase [Prevotella sp.]
MKNDKGNSSPKTDLSVYLEAIERSFEPVENPEDATHWLSTDEVADAIRDIDPAANIDKTLLVKDLMNAGYKIECKRGTQGLQFRWMLRARN